ncbi:MAG: cell division protein FtsQ/DivIB [Candidatus Omnitrophota bacterium]
MRRNKPVVSRPRGRRPSGILPFAVLVFVSLSLAVYAVQSFKKLSFFKVKDVIIRDGAAIRDDRNADFKYLIGKNIFSLDLKKHTRFIKSMYPAYRTARLVRFLPNQLCVDLMKRRAVASINVQPPLYIDDHMVFFESIDAAAEKGVPAIYGIDAVSRRFRSGTRCSHPALLFAVRVVQEAKKNKTLQGYSIERVDIHDPEYVSLFLAGPLEVRIGQDKLEDTLQILGSLLVQVGNGMSNIEYVDLRFKDPVIRFKGKEARR